MIHLFILIGTSLLIRHSSQQANLFTLPEAERILGEKAQLTDSSSTTKDNVLIYQCSYTAHSPDQKTGKTGAVYFMLEQYKENEAAHQAYASIKSSNENHEGVKVLNDLGDEAYFHSDEENFCFILVRKGKKMIRIKVNKITSKTSLSEFHLIARNITNSL